jgi:ABC-2 type transport system ATP-binding protein
LRDEAEQKGPSAAGDFAARRCRDAAEGGVSTTLLAARGVSKRFGSRPALEATDVHVDAGEILALVGPNGAGKSTLLAILAGALLPSTGSVTVADGVRVGWMPQRPAHYGRLSARQNLSLFARLEDERDPDGSAERLLARFELPPDDRPSIQLSVGNRQRLNLALAMLGSPRVLLLDEPTASLDAEQRARFWETAAAVRAHGGAVVLVTQNEEDVERLADRVMTLVEGAVTSER